MTRGSSSSQASRPLTDRDHPLLSEAIALWTRFEFDRALYTYERAMAADPSNARIIINASRAFFRRNLPGKGAALLDGLIAAMPGDARVHHMAGETYRLMSLPSAAIAAFERARTLGDRTSKLELELSALYEQAGRLDEAEGLVTGVLEREPASALAGLINGQLLARRKRSEAAAAGFRAIVERSDPRAEITRVAWANLASALDAMGDTEGAAEAIGRCKAPQLAADKAAWNAAQHVSRRFGAMFADLNGEHLAGWAERARAVEDLGGGSGSVSGESAGSGGSGGHAQAALLAGFPRSGTTLLEQILDAHPRVRGVEERDVLAGEIFPAFVQGHPAESAIVPILGGASRKQVARLRDRYIAALRDWARAAGSEAPGDAVLLDKNPGATPMIPVLRAMLWRAPLIVALRDPRDVVLSCYLRYLPLNPLSVNFLTVERAAEKYAFDMGAWLRFRELYSDGWIEVKYEDLVDDVGAVARRVIDVLGVGWDDSVLIYRDRLAKKIVTSPTYASVAEPVTRKAVGRWTRYERLLAPALPILEPFVKRFGYS